MAQDPLQPLDSGKIGLPTTDSAMNKVAPKKADIDGKGGEKKPEKEKGKDGGEEESDDEILTRARKRMDRCIQTESENRKNGLEAIKFMAGEQWPADVVAQRNFDKRPCHTVNKFPTFIHQVTNDQRQNRPAIHVSPVGEKSDIEAAKVYYGMIRSIERNSAASIAYDTAFESAVIGGWGYWRICTEYEDVDSFDQVITIKRVRNPFTIYMDPTCQEPDAADAKYAFVTEMVSRDEFKRDWPWADPVPFDQAGIGETFKEWVSKDEVRIAEYFEFIFKKRTLVALSNGHIGWEDELDEAAKAGLADGRLKVAKERESDVARLVWYKITCNQILERQECPGKWIPIVRVVGDEIDQAGKVKYFGVVYHAMDSQRMYNYWTTAETEMVALAPKAPFVGAEGQFEGYEKKWLQANTRSYPYLEYVPVTLAGVVLPPPQRQTFAGVPQGIVQARQDAAQDMIATTGIRFDATMNERMVDESGAAIRELRRSGDIGAFHYVDNLSRSLRHAGRIMIDLIPKIYDTKRVLTILREDDSEEQIVIDPNAAKGLQEGRHPVTGKAQKIFNPKVGDYGVTVTVGPSYATKRIEAANSMMEFARALPNTAMLIADLIAKNQDWPGASEMASRLAKAVPANLLAPEQKDISPQIQALLAALDGQVKALTAERQNLIKMLTDQQADRAQKQDKIDKDFEAKILALVQKAETAFQGQVGDQIRGLVEGVKSLTEALAAPPAGETAGQPPTDSGQS